MVRWMIFSTLATGLFYGLYCLTLRRDRWLQLSRAYLILTLGFSLVFSLIQFPSQLFPSILSAVPTETTFLTANLRDVVIEADPHVVSQTHILPLVYQVGLILSFLFLLIQMTLQLMSVMRLRRKHSIYCADDGFKIPRGASLILPPDNTAPYSFFNQIVVGTQDLSDEEVRCILTHESLHVSRNHSIDLMVMRLLCCIAWFNPFAWLMLRELRAVHEFQADDASLGACGREDYLHLLYRQMTGTGYGHITNNFQSINIKKRIVMMNKTKKRLGAWKLLVALPVVALLLVVGCKNAANPEADSTATQPQEIVANTNDTIYDGMNLPVEVDPMFPEGMESLYKYLAENIHYPEQAKREKIQGKVYIGFVIEKDGSIVDAKVIRGIGGGCDEEALRVVNAMPKWMPGKVRGENVRVQFNLPVVFKLK